jgi:hypothetical protein
MKHALLVVAVASVLGGSPAYADGKRDLEDGIAFYENLDTDRAMERLKSASTASDLDATSRAKAFLYLGLLQFETGVRSDAQSSWSKAFALDAKIAVPAGTSPKTIEALESVRRSAAVSGGGQSGKGSSSATTPAGFGATSSGASGKAEPPNTPGTSPKPPTPPLAGASGTTPGDAAKPLPTLAGTNPSPTDPAAITATGQAPAEESDSSWVWWAAGGAVAIIGAVVVVFLVTRGGECQREGGCLTVRLH